MYLYKTHQTALPKKKAEKERSEKRKVKEWTLGQEPQSMNFAKNPKKIFAKK